MKNSFCKQSIGTSSIMCLASTSRTSPRLGQLLLGNNHQSWVACSFCVVPWKTLIALPKFVKKYPKSQAHMPCQFETPQQYNTLLAYSPYLWRRSQWRRNVKSMIVWPWSQDTANHIEMACPGKTGIWTSYRHILLLGKAKTKININTTLLDLIFQMINVQLDCTLCIT